MDGNEVYKATNITGGHHPVCWWIFWRYFFWDSHGIWMEKCGKHPCKLFFQDKTIRDGTCLRCLMFTVLSTDCSTASSIPIWNMDHEEIPLDFGQDFLGMFALGRGVLRFWRKLASLEKHVSHKQLICQPLITHSWSTSGLIFTLDIVTLFGGRMLRSGLNQSRLGTIAKIGHPATCSIPF